MNYKSLAKLHAPNVIVLQDVYIEQWEKTKWRTSWSWGHKLLRHAREYQHFKESEGSLPRTKEPASGPYPELNGSSQHPRPIEPSSMKPGKEQKFYETVDLPPQIYIYIREM
jgi:hypothetical protein